MVAAPGRPPAVARPVPLPPCLLPASALLGQLLERRLRHLGQFEVDLKLGGLLGSRQDATRSCPPKRARADREAEYAGGVADARPLPAARRAGHPSCSRRSATPCVRLGVPPPACPGRCKGRFSADSHRQPLRATLMVTRKH